VNDLIRFYAEDIDRMNVAIADCEQSAEHFETTASQVTFDAEVHALMLGYAAQFRAAADEGRERLPELRRRLEYVGG
jgi:hypothetical protein